MSKYKEIDKKKGCKMQSYSLSKYDKGNKSWSKPLPVVNVNNESFRNECIRISGTLTEYLNNQTELVSVNIWNCELTMDELSKSLSSKLTKPFVLSTKSKLDNTTGEVKSWYLLTVNSSIVQL